MKSIIIVLIVSFLSLGTALAQDAAVVVAPVPASAPAVIPPSAGATVAEIPKAAIKEPVVIPNQESPSEVIKEIGKAVKSKNWLWLVSLVLMLVTFLFRKALKDRIPAAVTPWIAMLLSGLTTLFTSLSIGIPWFDAVSAALTMGLAAVGGWEFIGKKLFSDKPKASAPAAAPAIPAAQPEANAAPKDPADTAKPQG